MEDNDSNNNEYQEIQKKFNNFIDSKNIYHIQKLITKANSEDEEVKNESIDKLKNILKEKNNNLNIIYEAFLKNDNEEKINFFYNFFILLFKEEKNNFSNFLNSVKKYSENKKLKPLNEIITILIDTESKNVQLKINTFSFINEILMILLEFSNDEDYLEFLYILDDNGFFDFLDKNSFEKEEKLNELNTKFKVIIEKNLSKLEKSNEKYQNLKSKLEKLNKSKIINEFKELLFKFHNNQNNNISFYNNIMSLIKDENNFKIFYEIFAKNKLKQLNFSFFDIFAKYFNGNDELILKFIQISDDYENKFKINGFSVIVNFLEEHQNYIIQIEALKLVNTLLSTKDKKISFKILNKFYKLGIFEYLIQLIQITDIDKEIKVEISNYIKLVNKILIENKNDINFVSINKKLNHLSEIEYLINNTLDDFVIVEK